MPKSKNSGLCLRCMREYSSSQLLQHIRSKHSDLFANLIQEYNEFIKNNKIFCPCGNQAMIPILNAWFFAKTQGNEAKSLKKVCCLSHKRLLKVWNKGITKHDHKSLAKISSDRCGKNNPIHKVIADPEKYAAWGKAISDADVMRHRRGKTYEEIFGIEHAQELKDHMSISAKKRKIHGHTGHKHSEETKRKIGLKTIQRLGNKKVTKPQALLYNELVKLLGSNRVFFEKIVGFYSIDIVIDENIAVEVDGDFYHVNEALGYALKYDIQRKNLANDKRKNSYLKNRGWKIIRIWESEINSSLENSVKKIMELLNV